MFEQNIKTKTLFFKLNLVLVLLNNSAKSDTYFKDLTWKVDERSFHWSNEKQLKFINNCDEEPSAKIRCMYLGFCSSEYVGTHIDSPHHFNPIGWTIDHIPLKRHVLKGVLIDVSNDVSVVGRNFTFDVGYLDAWEKENGIIQNGSMLLIRYGWSKYYYNLKDYLGLDKYGNYNFPGMSIEAARKIAELKKIFAVGVDTPNLDPGYSKHNSVHRILGQNQIYSVKNLNLPFDLSDSPFFTIVMPLKILGANGSPARVLALYRTDSSDTEDIIY